MTPIAGISQQLATYPPGQSGELRVTEGGLEVRLRLADWDRLGCLLEALEVRSAQGIPLAFDPTRIAQRVTYLGEPLEVIEMINEGRWALLRSAPPCANEETVSFFEIILDRQRELSLRRYVVDRQCGERRSIPAPLTRHTVERLVVDLMDLASHR